MSSVLCLHHLVLILRDQLPWKTKNMFHIAFQTLTMQFKSSDPVNGSGLFDKVLIIITLFNLLYKQPDIQVQIIKTPSMDQILCGLRR